MPSMPLAAPSHTPDAMRSLEIAPPLPPALLVPRTDLLDLGTAESASGAPRSLVAPGPPRPVHGPRHL